MRPALVLAPITALAAIALALAWPAPATLPSDASIPADAMAHVPDAPDAAALPTPAAAPPPKPAAASEDQLLERARHHLDAQPAAALESLSQSEARFPDGRTADERSFLKMQALVHLGRIAPARDEAEAFLKRSPESPWAEQVEALTGVHPRRYGPHR